MPTGGSVAAGSASISSPRAGTLNINQSSSQAIVNWQSFSVGAGGTVNFNQPSASSATLNRVLGSTPSSIAGTINAPGTVILVNPNGIAITKSGVINAGSFAASTLDIKNEDFLAGKYKFSGNGSSATVTNAGRINVSDGGFAALLGGRVANDGVITARLGRVGLASGEMITLDMSGDGFVSVAVPSSQLGNLRDGTGKALVSNRGKIRADGGTVFLSAATASTLLRDAVNVPGSIRANSVGTHNGRIVIGGGAGGRVNVSGRLAARGKAPGTSGGQIDISGAAIALTSARIDASGATGGGKIRIGGDAQGSGDFQHAQSLSIDSATIIRADALDKGNGGTIVAWSDGLTTAKGTFSARGGPNGGNGGSVETSGHSVDFTGTTVNASATHGKAGSWLIDPTDLTVDSLAAQAIGFSLSIGISVTLQTNADGAASGVGVRSTGNGDININADLTGWSTNSVTLMLLAAHDININATLGNGYGSLVAQAGGSFTVNSSGSIWVNSASIQAGNGVGFRGAVSFAGQSAASAGASSVTANNTFFAFAALDLGRTPTVNAGFIDVEATLTTSGGATLNSRSDMHLQHIANTGGGTLTLNADSGGIGSGSVFFTNTTITTGGHVDIFYHPGSYSDPSFFPTVDGGGSITAWKLVSTPAQFAALNNLSGAQNQFYALNHDIDYSQSKTLVGGPSKVLINTQTIQDFYGTLNGFGHAILNPYVTLLDSTTGWNGSSLAALIGTNHGTIQNFGVIGGTFSGNFVDAAGLVITNLGTMSGAFSSASVSTNAGNAGGLVSQNANSGVINGGSHASGTVNAGHDAGGLVGDNFGIITDSYATGSVGQNKHTNTAGGLVGVNAASGQITFTYALGAVYGSQYAGGLVGVNAWASSGAGRNGCTFTCGGRGGGYISDSYAAGFVSSDNGQTGGVVAWLQFDVGNGHADFIGNFNSSSTLYWSYWDAGSTGQGVGIGLSYRGQNTNNGSDFGPGNTSGTSRPQYNGDYVNFVSSVQEFSGPYQIASYGYFNHPDKPGGAADTAKFSDHWYIIQGQSRPFLRAEFSTNIGDTHQLQLIDMNATASYKLMRNIDATQPLGSTSMWAFGNFAPISPVSWTDVLTTLTKTTHTVLGDFVEAYGVENISTPSSLNFTGNFDGQGHTISNLNVAAPFGITSSAFKLKTLFGTLFVLLDNSTYQTSAGLFDTVGSGGVVKNLGIVNGRFNADNTSAGAIAGSNYGTIVRVYADTATIVQSSSRAGGLVGVNFAGGSIFQSYASASVTASDGLSGAGGLVGENEGLVQDSYATGSTAGNGWVGGLVGYNGSNAYIVNTYSVGAVNVGANVGYAGRLAGQSVGTVLSSFYNSGSTLAASGGSNSPGTGLTTAQMQDLDSFATTYAGWNFAAVWAPPNKANQGGLGSAYYPELYALSPVIFVQGQTASRTYGSANPATSVSYTGGPVQYQFGPNNDGLNFAPGASSDATQLSNVGTYANAPTNGNTVTSTGGVNYRVVTKAGTLAVTPRPITVTADAGQSKVYGNADPGSLSYQLTSGNLVNGDTAASVFSGALARASGVNVGSYAITQNTLATNTNYALSYTGANFSITPRQLTVALIGSITKEYDRTNTATLTSANYTLTNVVAGDAVSASSLPTTGIYDSVNVGSNRNVTVNLSGALSGAAANNYALAGTASGNIGTITARALSGSAVITGINKSYDSTTAASGGAATLTNLSGNGVIAGDTVSINATAGTYDSDNAGARTVAITTGIGIGNTNYSRGTLTATGTGTIAAANLTVTAVTDSRTYDGTTASNRTPAVTGTIFGTDAPGFSQAFLSKNVLGTNGSTLVASGLVNDGNGGQNYAVQFVNVSGTITAAQLTYVATANSMIYGSTVPSLSGAVTGYVNGESLNTATIGQLAFSTSATRASSVGTYDITGAGLTAINGNYTFVQAAANSNAFTVNPAALTITARDQSKTYGQVLDLGTTLFTQTGLVTNNGNNDNIAGVTLTSTGAAATATVAAPGPVYAIVASAATGTGLSNYTIAYQNAPTGLMVNPSPVVVTANSGSSIYGAVPVYPGLSAGAVPGVTVSGLQNGEGVGVLTGLSNSFGMTKLTDAGSYTLSVIGVLSNPNYAVQTRVDGNWIVNPAQVIVTALGGTSVYGSSPLNPGFVASGLQNGQGVSVLTGLSNSFGIDRQTNAGNHTLVVAGGLTNTNYNVQSRIDGNWLVNRAPLSVTANNAGKTLGETVTFAGTEFTSAGLQNGETIGLTTLSSLGQPSTADLVGSPYRINISNAAGGTFNISNYQVTYVPGLLTVKSPPPVFQPLPGAPGTPANNTAISFQTPAATPVSFTTGNGATGGTRASNPTNTTVAATNPTEPADTTVTGSLGASGQNPAINNGRTFLPISQYDAAQYSSGALPDYASRDGEATIFTMIGRAIATDSTSAIYVDGFWNADAADRQGASDPAVLKPKVTFSDGAGHDIVPTDADAKALPIVAGTTDLGQLLGKGPLMIQGAAPASGGAPQWMLAIRLTDGGNGIIANDPATGRQVVLAYDPNTKTVGAVTSVFNPATRAWTPIADAASVKLAGDTTVPADASTALQSFVPASFLAVMIN